MSRSSFSPARFFERVIPLLQNEYAKWREPIVTAIARKERNPYKVLISTLISLRTKDEVTTTASDRLFVLADTPQKMVALNANTIAQAIHPAGFYKTKSVTILEVSKRLIDEFNGAVPSDLDTLLQFKGVGRKTANLVLTQGFALPAICVDTHVHRISNRFGVLKTRTPDETEFVLRDILPQKYWIIYNDLLVAFGQNICRPISPICSKCVLCKLCPKILVEQRR